MTTPDTPGVSAIPAEADLYDRLLAAAANLCSDERAVDITETAMTIFADSLRAQVDELTGIAADQPQDSPAGRAAATAYRAAAGLIRAFADELAGGAPS